MSSSAEVGENGELALYKVDCEVAFVVEEPLMATEKQRQAAKSNIKKAATAARSQRSIANVQKARGPRSASRRLGWPPPPNRRE